MKLTFFSRIWARRSLKQTGSTAPAEQEPEAAKGIAPVSAHSDPGANTGSAVLCANISTTALGPNLGQAAEGLLTACRSSENDFLRIGRQLQAVHSHAERLTTTIGSILQVGREDHVTNTLHTIATQSAQVIACLDRTSAGLQADLDGIASICSDLRVLRGKGDVFKKIAKKLKMVALNITIESAHTSDACKTFTALAEEIKSLSTAVFEIAGHIHDDTTQAEATLHAIHAEMLYGGKQLSKMTVGTRQALEVTLSKMDGFIDGSIMLMNATGKTANAVAGQVAEVVVGMQMHDNITQRAQHACEALNEADRLLHAEPYLGEDSGRQVHAILSVQQRQIASMAADISLTGQRGRGAITRLGELIKDLTSRSGAVFSSSVAGQSDEHEIILQLRHALCELVDLIDSSSSGIGRLTDAKRQTAGTIERLTHYIDEVREVNFDIHLKALNAIVKSTRLGSQGKGIEVLVVEMKELAGESNHFVAEITQGLEKIALNTALNGGLDGGDGPDSGQSACDRLRLDINTFTSVCGTFEQRSREAFALSRQLQKLITETDGYFNFFPEFSDTIENSLAQVSGTLEELSCFAQGACDASTYHAKGLTERYTMQKERDIYYSTLVANTVEAQVQPDENFENVELF
jgi:methyl-accepting chemotaxis protein